MRIVVVVFDHEAVSSKLSKTVTLFTLIFSFIHKQARKSSEDAQAAGYARFEKVWAR